MNGASLETKPDTGVIAVKWYKNGENEENFDRLVFIDTRFPFQFSPELDENGQPESPAYGDIITAEVGFNLGATFTVLKRLVTVVIGDPREFRLDQVDEGAVTVEPTVNRNLHITVAPEFGNDEFYRRYFVPSPKWTTGNDNVPLEGDDATEFPVLETSGVKYGDTLSLNFSYEIGALKGVTESAYSFTHVFDDATSRFSISPKVPDEGADLSLDFSEYADDALAQYEARWVINGKEDPTVKVFTYPGSKLNFGDHVQLYVDLEGTNSETSFNHVAEVYVGVKLGDGSDDPNLADIDSDGDGTSNSTDYLRTDAECSGAGEGNPDDRDGDGLPDLVEMNQGSNPNKRDTDGDGYTDAHEYAAGTDPNDASSPGVCVMDQDRDGLSDEAELALGLFVKRQ